MYVYIKHIMRFCINSAKRCNCHGKKDEYISITICKVCFKNRNSNNKTLCSVFMSSLSVGSQTQSFVLFCFVFLYNAFEIFCLGL